MEEVIEVDEKDRPLGSRPRGDFYGGKYIHRAVHLILLNPQNQILLQKRAQSKKWYPGLWEYSVSGTVQIESYWNCIKRETKEELGISIPLKRAFKYFTSDEGIDRAWRTVFMGRTDEELTIDREEIESIRWLNTKALKDDITKNREKYTPQFLRGLEIFFRNYNSIPV